VTTTSAAQARAAKAEQMGFTAYGVTRDMDDPVSKALHGLLDHAVETDRRICVLLDKLTEAGICVTMPSSRRMLSIRSALVKWSIEHAGCALCLKIVDCFCRVW
jgi:hypothetical protein